MLIRDIRSLLFIKVVRNRGSIYYTNSRSRERKKNDIEKTAKQGSTTVSALIIFYSFCQNKLLRESSLVRKFVTPKVSNYSNKLRLGPGRCHLEQRAFCLNVNWQIQVGTMGHFLIRGIIFRRYQRYPK